MAFEFIGLGKNLLVHMHVESEKTMSETYTIFLLAVISDSILQRP